MSEEEKNREVPSSPPVTDVSAQIIKAHEEEGADSPTATSLAVAGEKVLELDRLRIENDRLKNELAEAKDLRRLRKIYAFLLFALIVLWLFFVLLFVYWSAVGGDSFKLADSVLIAFITSTTVSVLGLFVIVANWLFPSSKSSKGEVNTNK